MPKLLNSISQLEILDDSKILGEGSFSKVVKVRHRDTGELFALKIIDTSRFCAADLEGIEQEVRLHQGLEHSNIVRFVDSLQDRHMLYILLEYANNGALFFFIHSRDGIPEHLALRFFYQVLQGIKYLHTIDVVHRDLKPENILLDDDLNAKLCDFGWSASLKDPNCKPLICGTIQYLAPEAVSLPPPTKKLDIWGLGILLYEFMHGELRRSSSI